MVRAIDYTVNSLVCILLLKNNMNTTTRGHRNIRVNNGSASVWFHVKRTPSMEDGPEEGRRGNRKCLRNEPLLAPRADGALRPLADTIGLPALRDQGIGGECWRPRQVRGLRPGVGPNGGSGYGGECGRPGRGRANTVRFHVKPTGTGVTDASVLRPGSGSGSN
jgi:hypothetical protein